jgi:hypothetical protein
MLWEEGMDGKGTTTYTSCAAQTAHTPQLNKASRSGSQHDAWYLAGRPITVQTRLEWLLHSMLAAACLRLGMASETARQRDARQDEVCTSQSSFPPL